MRTTVDLDEDILAAVEKMRAEEGRGLSEAVNVLARRGLTVRRARRPFVPQAFDMGAAKIDLEDISEALGKLDALAAK